MLQDVVGKDVIPSGTVEAHRIAIRTHLQCCDLAYYRALEPWPKRTVMLDDEEFAIGVPDLSDEEADDDGQCTHAVSSTSTWADDGGSSSSEEEWEDDGMSSSPPHPPYTSVPYEVVCRSSVDPSYALLRWDCRQ